MSFIERLKSKWKLESVTQAILVLTVFAFTGTSVLGLKWVFTHFVYAGSWSWWGIGLYILCIVPLYNLLLLFWGFVFGQHRFFIAYEKRFLNRITRQFKKKNSL